MHAVLLALAYVANGVASWYGAPTHTCAMRFEPMGERITIVNDRTGARSWCIVDDRGPYVRGRVIDVSPDVARALGFYETGLAYVRLYR